MVTRAGTKKAYKNLYQFILDLNLVCYTKEILYHNTLYITVSNNFPVKLESMKEK